MLHDYHRVSLGQQDIESFEKLLYIIEMQPRGRFVEKEEDPFPAHGIGIFTEGEEIRQLDPLALASGKGGRTLAQLYVRQTDIHQRLQAVGHLTGKVVFLSPEEGNRFLHAHVQYVVYILSLVAHLEDIRLESLASTCFADHSHVGHELHRYPHESVSLTLRAPSAVLVE